MVIKDLSAETITKGIQSHIDQVETMREAERQALLSYYEHNSTDQFVRKYFEGTSLAQIPVFTQAFLRRAVDQRALVYKDNPNIKADQKYFDATPDLNTVRRQQEKFTFLLGTMGCLSRFDKEAKKLKHSPLTIFKPLFLEGETEPIAVMYPIFNYDNARVGQQKYVVWSRDYDGEKGKHFLFDGSKRIAVPGNEDMVNDYGVLPVTFTHRSPQVTGEFWVEGASDLKRANLHLDIMLTQLMLAYRFDAIGVKWMKNVDVDENEAIPTGTDKFLMLPEEADIGRLESANMDQLIAAAKFTAEVVLQNNHLMIKWAGDSQAKSGEALKMENIENYEQRESSVEDTWRKWERDRFAVDRIILEKHGIKVTDQNEVDFVEPTPPMSQAEEREQWSWEFTEFGDERKREYWRQRDPEMTDEDINKLIAPKPVKTFGSLLSPE